MSDEKKPKKGKKEKTESAENSETAPTKKAGMDWRLMILSIAFLACALAFLPTTALLFLGMMPTFAALIVDPTPDRIKTMAVAAMNMAGVVPFLLALWTSGNPQDITETLKIIANPNAIITMYGAAAAGYIIFYTVSGFMASLLLQKGRTRIENIQKRMVELERKWGREVTGSIPLDDRGFAEEMHDLDNA